MPFRESRLANASVLLYLGSFRPLIWEKSGRTGVFWVYFQFWFILGLRVIPNAPHLSLSV